MADVVIAKRKSKAEAKEPAAADKIAVKTEKKNKDKEVEDGAVVEVATPEKAELKPEPKVEEQPKEAKVEKADPNTYRPDPKAAWHFFAEDILRIVIIVSVVLLFYAVYAIFNGVVINALEFAKVMSAAVVEMLKYGLLATLVAAGPLYLQARAKVEKLQVKLDDKVLTIEEGITSRQSVSLNFRHIVRIDVVETLLARFLGIAEIYIETTSTHGYGHSIRGLKASQAAKLKRAIISKLEAK